MPNNNVLPSSVMHIYQLPYHVEAKQIVETNKDKHYISPFVNILFAIGRMKSVVHELDAHQAQKESNDVEVCVHEDKAFDYINS